MCDPLLYNQPSLTNKEQSLIFLNFSAVIPQTCRYKSKKYECGLSISCVLNGGIYCHWILWSPQLIKTTTQLKGKPLDLCSGGMIWSCCVDLLTNGAQDEELSQPGSINNASEYILLSIVNNQMNCWFRLLYQTPRSSCIVSDNVSRKENTFFGILVHREEFYDIAKTESDWNNFIRFISGGLIGINFLDFSRSHVMTVHEDKLIRYSWSSSRSTVKIKLTAVSYILSLEDIIIIKVFPINYGFSHRLASPQCPNDVQCRNFL